MFDLDFTRAYNRGRLAAGEDYLFHWRVHTALWAAHSAMRLNGDFVECGVNRGFISSAIMEFLNWNQYEQTFYLLDTFNGIDPSALSEDDLQHGVLDRNKTLLASEYYVKSAESVKINFSQWQNVRIVEGSIPQTLSLIDPTAIAYLHLDLNCAGPEIEAIKFFWNRLLPGAIILLDDYAYRGYESQKRAWDVFARQKQVMIASLPTGQGLLLKPPGVE
ncbi:MAG: TylF/MycF/NovP-related O-methyltransferase [Synechococcaceae cyanobacterium]|nr:TylF/MycF/NovP-related O-methyltransferase [Synechococcaceae cyanobacterium]